jgi:glycosyltransferase involved in cell wall biosynthesis
MTDPLGQSQVIPYLQGLKKHGYNIYILSCEKKQAYEKNKEKIVKILQDADINWVPLSYTKKPPVVSTMLDIIKLRRAARRIHLKNGISLVHTRPGIPALVGLWLKQKYGIKFLNDIREFYADSRVDGGMWNTSNILYRTIYNFFKYKENEQVKESDGIVCLTHAAEKIITRWEAYDAGVPLKVIPCSADLDLFNPLNVDSESREKFKKQLGLQEDDFVVTYLGSIGGWYMTAEMMRLCKKLSEKIPKAKFLFISPHLHEYIAEIAEQYGVPREKIISVQAGRTEVPVLLSFSTYSVFFIKPCYSKLSSSPTKHGELMAMGIPVISNSGVGDVKEIIDDCRGGIVIHDFSDASLDRAAELVKNSTFDKSAIRKAASIVYSLDNAIKQYTGIYDAILSEQRI